ncbi:MAG: hydroxymethylbilane synthase [Planctomycetes bacterium]|nr:hydroxymethylbilane synthase [Planctomycetota bacterium]
MTVLRVGTRGSRLALTQTRWVCDHLRKAHGDLEVEEIIIATHGDTAVDQPFDDAWPVGSFVNALERALLDSEIDFAVHSYKDLPSASPPGLVIAAIPRREVVQDVLVTREEVTLDALPAGFRVGTSSPRRAAQMRRLADVEIVPIRGNVPTRIEKIETEGLGGVILAAAGLRRMGIEPPHVVDLPPERFVPAPAQGALAVQTRADDPAAPVVALLDDALTRRLVAAERSFLAAIGAGCRTPVGALARSTDDRVELRGQLFDDDGLVCVEAIETGQDPRRVGAALAERLVTELRTKTCGSG